MKKIQLDIPKDEIALFCRQNHVRKLALFGSILREDFREDSDVDILVEFEPGYVPGFIALYSLEEKLKTFFPGHEVDLVTEKFLNHRIRHQVLAEAKIQYEAAHA
ncbi:MAG: nucleotidyltransferase domain-containing protein [Deltaproteobacteria bacterium]|nr:nucleotidyltransferase domain-containing protein [Deltaproteobacteria bacterium]